MLPWIRSDVYNESENCHILLCFRVYSDKNNWKLPQLTQKYLRELLLFSMFTADLSDTNANILAWVMIIDSFIIEGFSNIEHIRLDLGEINALIAPNGYGKSNVLSAIYLCSAV